MNRVDDVAALMAQVAPVTAAQERLLAVPELLAGLFPGGGLQQGWSIAMRGTGGWSAALALLGPALEGDGWVAVVGGETLGLVAAQELGVRLERVLLVESPGHQAAEVLSTLIEAVDVICLGPEVSVAGRSARRLQARAQEQGTVLVHLGKRWPEPVDVQIEASVVEQGVVEQGVVEQGVVEQGVVEQKIVEPAQEASGSWLGIGCGHGYLQSRLVVLTATGRRSMARPRRVEVLLPGPGGGLAPAPRQLPTEQLRGTVSVVGAA